MMDGILAIISNACPPSKIPEIAAPKACIHFLYCWFSHDVTKIKTKKLSILPRFCFHDALEELKTNFHTNFRFKRALDFVIEYA